jgi:hypothetical protein
MATMTENITRDDLDAIDVEALDRALSIALADDERTGSDQMKYFLANDGWWWAASSASYCLQCNNLGLKPWQEPPCHGEPCPITGRVNADASKLMKRLISYGLSKYECNPINAIAAVTVKKRKIARVSLTRAKTPGAISEALKATDKK